MSGGAALHGMFESGRSGDVGGVAAGGAELAAGAIPLGRQVRRLGGAALDPGRHANGQFTQNWRGRQAAMDAAGSSLQSTATAAAINAVGLPMIDRLIIVLLITASVPLFIAMARTKFSYLHPKEAGKQDISKVPSVLSGIVRFHDLLKWGGASLYWLGGCALIWFEPTSVYFRYFLYMICFCGGASFVLALIWRIYILAK